mmetsp:Transcript_33042/g.95366  ORF Transcript_33042/g.95366 Transcript_33042/m.95366 type:complete len:237 (+) Transcript_33042:597-1307(+)
MPHANLRSSSGLATQPQPQPLSNRHPNPLEALLIAASKLQDVFARHRSQVRRLEESLHVLLCRVIAEGDGVQGEVAVAVAVVVGAFVVAFLRFLCPFGVLSEGDAASVEVDPVTILFVVIRTNWPFVAVLAHAQHLLQAQRATTCHLFRLRLVQLLVVDLLQILDLPLPPCELRVILHCRSQLLHQCDAQAIRVAVPVVVHRHRPALPPEAAHAAGRHGRGQTCTRWARPVVWPQE